MLGLEPGPEGDQDDPVGLGDAGLENDPLNVQGEGPEDGKTRLKSVGRCELLPLVSTCYVINLNIFGYEVSSKVFF